MRTAIAYTRVSTERQLRLSPELQREKIAAFVAEQGWTLHPQGFGEAGSGRKLRAELDLAVDLACSLGSKGALVTFDMTRLFRSTQHGLNLLDRLARAKVLFKSVADRQDTSDQSAVGKFVRTLLLASGELFANQGGEKIKAQNARTVAQLGYRTNGQQPYGFKLENGRRVEVPEELATIASVRELVEANGRTYREMAEILNDRGILSPSGSRWTATGLGAFVRRVL